MEELHKYISQGVTPSIHILLSDAINTSQGVTPSIHVAYP